MKQIKLLEYALMEINREIDMALINYRAFWKSGHIREEQFWNNRLGTLNNERGEILELIRMEQNR